MRRWLFNLAAVLSLLLFVATVGLWVRSHGVQDTSGRNAADGGGQIGVSSARGSLIFTHIRTTPPSGGTGRAAYFHFTIPQPLDYSDATPPVPNGSRLKLPGVIYFNWTKVLSPRPPPQDADTRAFLDSLAKSGKQPPAPDPRTFTYRYQYLIVSHWLVAGLSLLVPLRWVQLRVASNRRAKRADDRVCQACGYDLRASPDRCPECGAVPASARTAT